MALRLVEAFVPVDFRATAEALVRDLGVLSLRSDAVGDRHVLLRVLVDAARSEAVLDAFHKAFADEEGYSVVVLPVEAYLPRKDAHAEEDEDAEPEPVEPDPVVESPPMGRVSREELYHDVTDAIRAPPVFFALTVLSAIVAAVGLYENNVAVLIGAMVIAPLLGPNVAFSLGVALGDVNLARRAIVLLSAAVATALVVSYGIGAVVPYDPLGPDVTARTNVDYSDIALALAAGAAGVLAFTTGAPVALVGVMVAVALMPPLVAAGLLLGGGHPDLAGQAGLLVLVNLACVNLAAALTFTAQRLEPRILARVPHARRGTWLLVVTAILLLALVVWLAQ